MLETLRNAFKIKDIRKKIIFTFLMLIVIRIGSCLPIPGVDSDVFANWFASQTADGMGFFDAITGGSFYRMSIFALNITPYITSSIIMQLLTIAIPKLEEMQRDGEEGRKKIAEITRYLTVALALIEAVAMTIGFRRGGYLEFSSGYQGVLDIIMVIFTLTAGSAVLMWIGERITEKGVGNGISIVLTINIISRMPDDIKTLYDQFISECTESNSCGSYHSCNHCWNGTVCCILTGRREKNSGTVFQEDPGKKAGWRSVNIHSSQGKHRWCYPGYLCTVTVADAGNHCQSSWQRKWNRYWEQDLKRYVTVKLV